MSLAFLYVHADAALLDFEGLPFTNIVIGGNVIPNPASVLTDDFKSAGVLFGKTGVSTGVAVVRDSFAPSSGLNSVAGLNAAGLIPGSGIGGAAVADIFFSFVGPGTTTPSHTDFVSFTIGDVGVDLDQFEIRSFDLEDTQIDTQAVSGNSRFGVTIAAPEIHRVEVDFLNDFGYSLDDLEFNTPILIFTPVDLDIKPGSDQNPINLSSRGVLPVALLTDDDFDATDVDVDTILFGDPVLLDGGAIGVAPLRSGEEDVNGDGLTDLTLKFSMRDLVDKGALGDMSVEGILIGLLLDGTPFEGSDAIRLVPPGDGNNDQIVDGADYTIWANNFGTNGNGTPGDFDEDNHVDAADYTIWANNFGTDLSVPGSAAAAAPEPSTFALSALGLIGLLAHGWRRRRRA